MSTPNVLQSTTVADLARLVERVNVKSPELYCVDLSGDCPCEDYQRRGISFHGHKFCKHQLAALFYRRLADLVAERRPSRRFARLQPYRPQRTARPARATAA